MSDKFPATPLPLSALQDDAGIPEVGHTVHVESAVSPEFVLDYRSGSSGTVLLTLLEEHFVDFHTYRVVSEEYNAPTSAMWWHVAGPFAAEPTGNHLELAAADTAFFPIIQLLVPTKTVLNPPSNLNNSLFTPYRHSFPPQLLRPFRFWMRALFTCVPASHRVSMRKLAEVTMSPTAGDVLDTIPAAQRAPLTVLVAGNMAPATARAKFEVVTPDAAAGLVLHPGTNEPTGGFARPAVFVSSSVKEKQLLLDLPAFGYQGARFVCGIEDGPVSFIRSLGALALGRAVVGNEPEFLEEFFDLTGNTIAVFVDDPEFSPLQKLPLLTYASPVPPSPGIGPFGRFFNSIWPGAKLIVAPGVGDMEGGEPEFDVVLEEALEDLVGLSYFHVYWAGHAWLHFLNKKAPENLWLQWASARDTVVPLLEYGAELYSLFAVARGSLWDKFWVAKTLDESNSFLGPSEFALVPHPFMPGSVFEYAVRTVAQFFGFGFGLTIPVPGTYKVVSATSISGREDGHQLAQHVQVTSATTAIHLSFVTRGGEVRNQRLVTHQEPEGVRGEPVTYWTPHGGKRMLRLAYLDGSGAVWASVLPSEASSLYLLDWQKVTGDDDYQKLVNLSGVDHIDAIGFSRKEPNSKSIAGSYHSGAVLALGSLGGAYTNHAIGLPPTTLDWDGVLYEHGASMGVILYAAVQEGAKSFTVYRKIWYETEPTTSEWEAVSDVGTLPADAFGELHLALSPPNNFAVNPGSPPTDNGLTNFRRAVACSVSYARKSSAGKRIVVGGPRTGIILAQVAPSSGIVWERFFHSSDSPQGGMTADSVTSGGEAFWGTDIIIGQHSVYVIGDTLTSGVAVLEYMMPPALRDGSAGAPWNRLGAAGEDWEPLFSEAQLGMVLAVPPDTLKYPEMDAGLWQRHEVDLDIHDSAVNLSRGEGPSRLAYAPAVDGRLTSGASGLVGAVLSSSSKNVDVSALVVRAVEGGCRNLPGAIPDKG